MHVPHLIYACSYRLMQCYQIWRENPRNEEAKCTNSTTHPHRCIRLTRQCGGEQSGLVTLTFDLLTLKVVSQ